MTRMNPVFRTNHARPRRPFRATLLGAILAATMLAATAPPVGAQDATSPDITMLLPDRGPSGATFEVIGTGLAETQTARLGNDAALILTVTDTRILLQVPSLPSGPLPLDLAGPQGNATFCCFVVTAPIPAPPPVTAASCTLPGFNQQCNGMGSIKMASYQDVHGVPVIVATEILLAKPFDDRSTRWVMFSLRNVTPSTASPVTISVVNFSTSHGAIAVTQLEDNTPSKWTAWVDVLDAPIGVPILVEANVGATQRGAYRLEALVMAFDRGYEPGKDEDGAPANLYSFTLLGVNEATPSTYGKDRGTLLDGNKTFGFEAFLIVAACAIVLAAVGRRRA